MVPVLSFCQTCNLMGSKLDMHSLANIVNCLLKAVAAAINQLMRACTKAFVMWDIPVTLSS
jgi:hypothetical protein